VLAAATPFLMRPWVAGRLPSARGAGVAGAGLAAAGLWLAAALWYRVAEVAPDPKALDVAKLREALPKPEDNAAGRLTAAALRGLVETEQAFAAEEARARAPAQHPRPGQTRPPPPQPVVLVAVARQMAETANWSAADLRGQWLDRLFNDPWAGQLEAAADEPDGVTVDPRLNTLFERPADTDRARTAAFLLVARGLQFQAKGDPAAFPGHLHTGLALARNLRHNTTRLPALIGRDVEAIMLRGVERWLERLHGRPDLLRQALEVLQTHERARQTDAEEVRRAAFLATFVSFQNPRTILQPATESTFLFPSLEGEGALLRVSWQVPWEQERLRRLLDELASGDPPRQARAADRSPHVWLARQLFAVQGVPGNAFAPARPLARARGAVLQVALRLYQAEAGRTAGRLADLVPNYLRSVPADPFDGRPFRYRVSSGESLNWRPENSVGIPDAGAEPAREVPAGQGILWCVGDDLRDDGGRTQQNPPDRPQVANADVIFLVPPEPARR
jgi:hypothetical protein